MNKSLCITTLLMICLFATSAFGQVTVKLVPGQSDKDRRHHYPHTVLKAALDATVDTDGPYTIEYAKMSMSRERALIELKEGRMINVHEAPTQQVWEEQVIPIRIPIRKGLLGYRLFLINKKDIERFKAIATVDELKKMTAGLGKQWSITKVMKAQKFEIVEGTTYEGLFAMLASDRFDYFSRGINEIFPELDSRRDTFPNMVIEPTKGLYITNPTYLFVSPKMPELADRIERGLNILVDNGTLKTLFEKEFADDIKRAELSKRKILREDNPLLSKETPLNDERLWFVPK